MTAMRKYIIDMNMKWVTVNGPRTYVGPIHDHYDIIQTPTLYVLDEKKKIIAKNVPIEELEEFLKHHERLVKLGEK